MIQLACSSITPETSPVRLCSTGLSDSPQNQSGGTSSKIMDFGRDNVKLARLMAYKIVAVR